MEQNPIVSFFLDQPQKETELKKTLTLDEMVTLAVHGMNMLCYVQSILEGKNYEKLSDEEGYQLTEEQIRCDQAKITYNLNKLGIVIRRTGFFDVVLYKGEVFIPYLN